MRKLLLLTAAALFMLPCLREAANAQGMSYSLPAPSREDPAVNVYLSARYDWLLRTNLRFRHYRMWKECHTVNWPGLREDCIASFDQYEPIVLS